MCSDRTWKVDILKSQFLTQITNAVTIERTMETLYGYIAVYGSLSQCLQCVAVCCSVLQCVAVCAADC